MNTTTTTTAMSKRQRVLRWIAYALLVKLVIVGGVGLLGATIYQIAHPPL